MAENGTILIVDDNPVITETLRNHLGNLDYRVVVAESGKGAGAQSRIDRPVLVLMDIMLFKMDGFEACQRIDRQKGTTLVPVVFMSALEDQLSKTIRHRSGGVT